MVDSDSRHLGVVSSGLLMGHYRRTVDRLASERTADTDDRQADRSRTASF